MGFYFFWVIFFAFIAGVLGANETLAGDYTGMNQTVGYFLNTFENSLGNINAPTIAFLKNRDMKIKILDYICIYLIYFFWWIAQILLLVVLLNFVIALISQYYEDTMNSAVKHKYIMRHQLNQEYFIYNQFMIEMNFMTDRQIDTIILIDGDEVEDESDWKGLTQAVKSLIVKENDHTKKYFKKEVNVVNDKVQLLREDNKALR